MVVSSAGMVKVKVLPEPVIVAPAGVAVTAVHFLPVASGVTEMVTCAPAGMSLIEPPSSMVVPL